MLLMTDETTKQALHVVNGTFKIVKVNPVNNKKEVNNHCSLERAVEAFFSHSDLNA